MVVSNHFINNSLNFLKCFKGTFSCNNLPSLKECSRKIFIVNLDTTMGPGTHFIFLEIDKHKCFYFDPLGFNLKNKFIKKYLSSLGISKVKTLNKQIQSFDSAACGLFTICICVARCFFIDWRKILSFFSKNNLVLNEKKNILKLLNYISHRKNRNKCF